MPQTFLCSRSVRKPSHLLPHLPQPPILPPGDVTAPGGLPLFTWLVSDVRMAVPSESPAPCDPGIDWLGWSTQLISTSSAGLGSSHLTSSHSPTSRPSRGVQVLLLKTGVTCLEYCTVVYSRCGRRRTSSLHPAACVLRVCSGSSALHTVLAPLQHCTLPLQLLLPGMAANY